ncbi:CDP-alcohol phosphatidyltransferase family protein [Anaeromicropila populeti]|uniref:CDP-diacylglycerol--glycerol-3-phosphate 3-phosphatidyltransferase n=1 Tax=Anaeromicropila populeti TaxID=37658 RepID=A0A1I6J049_9FIRM|nr:CDP-alcohol phosphatidyltransferase family protein [Anaeromicropila populeti]SFR72374.1 CDP-diacylglycerol--glycerol-3-phosphate 3-phosphatidyltransferase [Anaeromicropila populeti]
MTHSKRSIIGTANVISMVRILLSVFLLFVFHNSAAFIIIYCLCGISDIMDGYIARKTNTESKLGSMLDSIADIVFVGVTLIFVMNRIEISFVIYIWIAGIAGIRIISVIIGYFRFRELVFLHTYANKITGILLFLYPVLYQLTRLEKGIWVVCTAASMAAMEEVLIHATSKAVDRNRKSILVRK